MTVEEHLEYIDHLLTILLGVAAAEAILVFVLLAVFVWTSYRLCPLWAKLERLTAAPSKVAAAPPTLPGGLRSGKIYLIPDTGVDAPTSKSLRAAWHYPTLTSTWQHSDPT